ncbi:MAG: hypothetical protein Q7R96_00020 [Nanoarchaeota archaeon]|nr:hypothetical protein [Nanoarchaeota archaeon]
MSLAALEQHVTSILETIDQPGTADEKKNHLLTLVEAMRKILKEELEELKIHGND